MCASKYGAPRQLPGASQAQHFQASDLEEETDTFDTTVSRTHVHLIPYDGAGGDVHSSSPA
ncbi:hypothetical protein HMPREF9062_0093 [Actinomyces sp. oral taxon 448 str. F0400]|nr:hypothetical protein HMPREF9062_0093 [Actinomyces sp. oral taxon 448 str. F0400]